MAEGEAPLRIDVWSDVVCPYCYVGKRHIEAAIARTETAVEITYRAFQLHPQAPADQSMPIRDFWPLVYPGHPGDTAETDAVLEPIIAAGRAVGLTLDYSRMWSCNTRTTHRLAKAADAAGVGLTFTEAAFRGYFTLGLRLNEPEDLLQIAKDGGLDVGVARAVLDDEALHGGDVDADVALAAQIGIGGVPFAVFGGKVALSGAQPPDVILRAIESAAARHG